jgi:hypothetical protein
MMVRYAQDSGKINFFREICAIMNVAESIRLQKQKLCGISSGIVQEWKTFLANIEEVGKRKLRGRYGNA